MKSSIVVLNTSSIVDNAQDLLKTDYLICWLKDGIENILRKSDKGELIKKVFKRKQFNFYKNNFQRCDFQREEENSFELDHRLNNVVFLMEELHLSSAFAFLNIYLKNAIFFGSEKPFYEIISAYFYRKGLKFPNLSFLCYQQFENALQKHLIDEIRAKFFSLFHNPPHVYTRKKDLVTDFAQFKDVELSYFDDLFLIGLLFYLVLVVLFLFDRFLGAYKRRIANSIRRTRRRWIREIESKLFNYVGRLYLARRRARLHRIVMHRPFYLMAFCLDPTFEYRNAGRSADLT